MLQASVMYTKGMIEHYSEPNVQGKKRKGDRMEKIAVIDTETNWNDQVMSIGIVMSLIHISEPTRLMLI